MTCSISVILASVASFCFSSAVLSARINQYFLPTLVIWISFMSSCTWEPSGPSMVTLDSLPAKVSAVTAMELM